MKRNPKPKTSFFCNILDIRQYSTDHCNSVAFLYLRPVVAFDTCEICFLILSVFIRQSSIISESYESGEGKSLINLDWISPPISVKM